MRFFISFIVCVLAMPLTIIAAIPEIPEYHSQVYDKSNVISNNVEQQLNEAAMKLESATGNVIVMMTMDRIEDLEPNEFGAEVMHKWSMDDAKSSNGMLIIVTTNQGSDNSESWIAVGGGLEEDFPDELLKSMIDTDMTPSLEKGDYTTAFANIFKTVYVELGGDAGGANIDMSVNEDDGDLPTAIIIFIVVIYLSLSKYGGGGPGGRRRTARRIYRTGGFPTSGF